MTAGYEGAQTITTRVIGALREVAVLIGEVQAEPVTLSTGDTVTPGLGLREESAALEARARSLDEGLFTLIVLGEFKNGKSTLINGMLGTKALPAKAAPATAVITVLVHGESRNVTIHPADGSEPRTIPWETFLHDFQLTPEDQETLDGHGAADRFADVAYAQMECLHPICAAGVRLIDSPGLGEHISRTRVATQFLKQSQAVVLVLNATRILTPDERYFIDGILGPGRLPHVFFAVNRMDQVDQESAADIRAWVHDELAPHFEGPEGRFDEDLYARRVFFINARGALEARGGEEPDGPRLEASGVPALERELERFLAGGERLAAVVDSTVALLAPVLTEAEERIAMTKHALREPLEELEARAAEAESRLGELEARKHEIEDTIARFTDVVQHKVYADLRAHVEEMEETWPEDAQRLMDLEGAAPLTSLLAAYTQEEARERMARALYQEVQRYLEIKFGEWAEQAPRTIRPDIETMMAEVEAQVEDLQIELDDIASTFAGTTLPARQRTGRMPLAIHLGDMGGLTEEMVGPGDLQSLVARVAQQAIAVFIVGSIILGGNFLLALLVVEGIQVGLHGSETQKRIRKTLGERIHENLNEQVAEKREFIFGTIGGQFRQLASGLTGAIGQQIEDVRAEQARILYRKQHEDFSAEAEGKRLDEIGAALHTILAGLR
jgi:Dynamin family